MYKRRKKITPAASSTLIGDNTSKSPSLSSQSSLPSSISIDNNRSTSPDDMFTQSPEKASTSGPVPSIALPSSSIIGPSSSGPSSSRLGLSSQKKTPALKRPVTEEVKVVSPSDESESVPLKLPKTNGYDSRKPHLSQNVYDPLKYFYETLLNSGMVVSRKGEPNLLSKSQFAFVRNLNRLLEKSSLESNNVNRFIENLEQYLSNKETLIAALSPTKNHPDANLPGDSMESLIQLLLSIESIQARLISYLLDKVAEYSVEGEQTKNDEMLVTVRMMMQSMRYLVKVIEPEPFTLKLFDLIHSVSSSMLKHEIISCLPDIVSDSQRKQTADELMELMKSEPHLSPSILFTLSNLWLEGDSLHQLQLQLIKTLRKTSLDQLPAFVRFITSSDVNPNTNEIINGIRSELVICHAESSSTQSKQTSQADISSTIFLIFEKLRDSVLKSKKLADLWLKNIEKVKVPQYHKPIDLLMLLILHSMTPESLRKRAVEAVFKKKIKMGHFRESLVQDTLSVGLVILKEHFSGLLSLLSALLLSPDLTVSNFGAFFYLECFVSLDVMSRKLIILELKDNVNMSKGNAKPSLQLLHDLASKYPDKVVPYFTLIMLLLDSVCEMRVCEVRELMDTLCLLAFDITESSFDSSTTQDELCIIVQKQLACPDPNLFRSGIIAGVIVIKHMAKIKQNQSNETPLTEEEEISLSPMASKAFNLFELVLMSTRSSAEAHVLVFDQFSHILMASDNLDKRFMKKISILMQGLLQSEFVIASSDYHQKDNALESSLQFCIDTDFEDPIVFNLASAVLLENSSQTQVPLVALPGLVRVIRGLELADLTEIDALVGCAVDLPAPKIYSSFNEVEPYAQRLALDCLFHVSNYFREILNSFVFLIKDGSPDKILQRLRAVVYFQGLISHCLPQALESYSPPKYYFDDTNGKQTTQAENIIKVPAGRKRQKKDKKKDGDGDDVSVDETAVESDEEKEDETISLDYSRFKKHLRELDFDVCMILTQPLTLTPQPIKDGVCSKELGPGELLLLLDDLDAKLRYTLGPRKLFSPKQTVGHDNLASIPTDLIVRNTYKLVPHLVSHLHSIIDYLHNLMRIHDGILDAPGMFCPGSHEIKQCLAFIFSIFNTYISWPDIESEVYVKCLIKCLVKLGGPNFNKKDGISRNIAVKAALIYLKDLGQCVQDLSSAVGLINLMKTIVYVQDDEDDKYDFNIGDLCGELLKRRWYDSKGILEKGTKVNQQQTVLLDIYLSDLGRIKDTLDWLRSEAETLTAADSSLTTFPHFNKTNLNILIRTLCKGLLNGLKEEMGKGGPKSQLETWDSVMNDLQSLIAIIKIHDSRINLRQFLKGCLPIMRYFLTHGMSVCSMMFKIESLEVSQTIKKLQVITRYIQSICNYSKVNKDNSLIHLLPGMRGTLEKILLLVKNMVLQNKCTDAFFMGSMRHKDIHGEIISTEEGEEERGDSEEPTPQEVDPGAAETSDNESGSESEENNGSMSDTC